MYNCVCTYVLYRQLNGYTNFDQSSYIIYNLESWKKNHWGEKPKGCFLSIGQT